ncbi:unnamed protein product [Moneuplotes crassus]|uniref:Uncharacterized protein n=1 Tax=Euplotes crassus TaxID=5936 RepID=A0AAD1URL8_EUPCR|nr:unnamed protein product [Moneuplotes crassus]
MLLQDEDLCERKAIKTMTIVLAILIAITVLCGVLLIISTFKFIRKFRLRKKLFSLFLITLNLALVFRIIYISRKLYVNRPYHCLEDSSCFRVFATFSPLWMLGSAGVLNSLNWALFCFSVKYFDRKNTRFYKRVKVIICSIFFIVLGIMAISYLTAIGIGCAHPNPVDPSLLLFIDWFGISIHFVVCISFVITGLILKKVIKDWNEEVGRKSKNRIIISILVLSIPFLVRVIYLIVKRTSNMDRFMNLSVMDDTFAAPLVMLFYIIIADLVPIGSQLMSTVVVVDSKDLHLHKIYEKYVEESTTIEKNISVMTIASSSQCGSIRGSSENFDVKSLVFINNSKEAGISFLGTKDDEESVSSLYRKGSDEC